MPEAQVSQSFPVHSQQQTYERGCWHASLWVLTDPFNRRDLKLGRRGLPVKGNIWRRWPKKLRTLKIDARRCRRTPPQQVMIPLLAVFAREAIRKRADGMYWYSASEHRRYFHSAHLALSTLSKTFAYICAVIWLIRFGEPCLPAPVTGRPSSSQWSAMNLIDSQQEHKVILVFFFVE